MKINNSMIKKIFTIVFAIVVVCNLITPVAYAFDITTIWNGGQLVPCGHAGPDDCNWDTLIKLANNIVVFLVWLSASLVVIAFCYAGFLYMTAFGEMGKVEQAHSIFRAAITGFFFVLCGWLIVATILKVLIQQGTDNASINSIVPFNNVGTIQQGSGQPR